MKREYAIKYTMTGVVYIDAKDDDEAFEKFYELDISKLKENVEDVDWDEVKEV